VQLDAAGNRAGRWRSARLIVFRVSIARRLAVVEARGRFSLRRTTASSLCSAFLLTTIAKRNVDLHPAAIRSRGTTVIAVRKCHASLRLPNRTVHAYFTGLMGIGPCHGERYCLGLGRKQKRLFAGASLYAPTR